jgi:hypothetical protein
MVFQCGLLVFPKSSGTSGILVLSLTMFRGSGSFKRMGQCKVFRSLEVSPLEEIKVVLKGPGQFLREGLYKKIQDWSLNLSCFLSCHVTFSKQSCIMMTLSTKKTLSEAKPWSRTIMDI